MKSTKPKSPFPKKRISVDLSHAERNQQTGSKLFDVWADKQDIMQEFHLSARTLHNWRKKKILPYSRLGNKIIYNRTKIEDILQDIYKKTQLDI